MTRPQVPPADLGEARPNMTSMIDVVFLLLVFFLVTMKFKTLDMKIEALLPRDRGPAPVITDPPERLRLDVRLVRTAAGPVRLKASGRLLGDTDDERTWTALLDHARAVRARHVANGGDPDDVDAEIDASPRVATGLVIRAVDTCVAADLLGVTFRGAPPNALASAR